MGMDEVFAGVELPQGILSFEFISCAGALYFHIPILSTIP
jgi:hypothetical protein